MSFFNETQREPAIVSEKDVSSGPRLGFQAAFEAAWDAQTRTESMYADAAAFAAEEARQFYKIKEAGLEPPPRMTDRGFNLRGVGQLEDVADYYNRGENADKVAADLASRNQHIERLKAERPELKLQTYEEMWGAVKVKAKAAETRWEEANTSFGGAVGGFVGGMLGSMSPVTDPLNAATLGVGGAGKTALARVATEAGGQAAIEAVNQFTGVQGARERLGLETSFGRSAEQVAMVGVGAGVLRGAGEGLGRWFRNTPKDPAPPIPPKTPELAPKLEAPPRLEYPLDHYLGPSRRAQTVLDAELTHVERQLDDGTPPWATKPATATALPGDVGFGQARIPTRDVEQLIEQADPETWRIYGKLQDKADSLRRAIDDVAQLKEDAASTAALKQLDEQIASLNATAQNAKGKKLAKLEAEMQALQEQRGPLAEAAKAGSPEVAVRRQSELRQGLLRIDEQMRDLAPALSRARAAAEEKFLAQQVDPEVAEMLRRNNPGSEVLQRAKWADKPVERIDLSPLTLEQRVPVRPTDKPGAPAAERAANHVRELDAATQQKVDNLAAFAKQPLDGETHVFMPDGKQVSLDTVMHLDDRKLTVRDFLREVNDDNALLESVSSCSLAKIS